MDLGILVKWLNEEPTYQAWFAKAYPNEPIDKTAVAKAIATFERTIVSDNSPFDQWLRGDKKAMTKQQIIGFRLFTDQNKGNCVACHQAPNFTDNGFHNIGLASYGLPNPNLGRYLQKPLPSLKGAFKTPTFRDSTLTAPYFHDGSAKTLAEVVEHYNNGGAVKTDLSPNMKPLNLNAEEKAALIAFMQALTTEHPPVVLPKLPPQRY
jgi:cytochrome c peroxidase